HQPPRRARADPPFAADPARMAGVEPDPRRAIQRADRRSPERRADHHQDAHPQPLPEAQHHPPQRGSAAGARPAEQDPGRLAGVWLTAGRQPRERTPGEEEGGARLWHLRSFADGGTTMTMSEKQKMLAGELYHPGDPEILADQAAAKAWMVRYNAALAASPDERRALLAERLASVGAGAVIRPPFHCDYGYNIHLGEGAFLNFNCVILD